MVNPFPNKELTTNILEKQFHEACQALLIEPSMSGDVSSFKVDYVRNPKEAEKNLQRTIIEFRNQLHGPAIALIECPDVDLIKSSVRALDDFPCVNIPSNARDNQYQALGWQIVAAKIGMQRCAVSSHWLNERISLSRYSHIPLGNYELDWLIHTADIFFARPLRDHQQILWVSDNGFPDLGGDIEEEFCYSDEGNQPVFTKPGAYRKFTGISLESYTCRRCLILVLYLSQANPWSEKCHHCVRKVRLEPKHRDITRVLQHLVFSSL